jgi:hypothetical protein
LDISFCTELQRKMAINRIPESNNGFHEGDYQVLIGGPYDDIKGRKNLVALIGRDELSMISGDYIFSHIEKYGQEKHLIYFWRAQQWP